MARRSWVFVFSDLKVCSHYFHALTGNNLIQESFVAFLFLFYLFFAQTIFTGIISNQKAFILYFFVFRQEITVTTDLVLEVSSVWSCKRRVHVGENASLLVRYLLVVSIMDKFFDTFYIQ